MDMRKRRDPQSRRQTAYVSILGTTQLHLRNPFVVAGWSAMFPGLGHLLLSKYLRGFLLFAWEIVININANINMAILYSFTGRFEMAKDILDIRWVLLYIPTYLFGIWDSYRTTIDLNNNYKLAAREDADIKPFIISAMEINYLDRRKPWVAAVWSFLMPGTGQLYIHRIVTSTFVVAWWIVIVHYSKLLPAIHYTLMGNFQMAKEIVNQHWLLNIPSVYFFAIYDAYANTVENNKLFCWEQAKYFNRRYQSKSFKMPLGKNTGGKGMYIVSTFHHSVYLELALSEIEMEGIKKDNIMAIPMDKRGEQRNLFDTLQSSDGVSLFDLPIILGAFLCLLGGIYGFMLTWGPILWGLIGMVAGMSIGLVIKLITTKKYLRGRVDKNGPEVVLIIQCNEDKSEDIKNILWKNHALGVRKLKLDEINL